MPVISKRAFHSALKIELLYVSVGLSVPLLEWCFTQSMTARYFLSEWFFSLVYGNCIGWATWFVAPRVFSATREMQIVIRWIVRAAAIIILCAAGCLVAGLVPKLVYGSHTAYWTNFAWAFRLSVLIAAVITFAIDVYERLQERLRVTELQLKTKELERERALKLATEARLASLESRIHPHFLFNTINSVSSLIHEDPDHAEQLLTQMAGLLRFSLDAGQTGLVPLEREMKIVRDYLDIESVRFGDRLRYHIDVSPSAAAGSVPPLSIQTLVENSVKYAVSARRQGAEIRVAVSTNTDRITIEVADDGPGFKAVELPSGHGLSNLQERLHALFGDVACLDIASGFGRTSVAFSVPIAGVKRIVA